MSYNIFALNPTSIVYSYYQDEDPTWKPMWFIIESECDLENIDGIYTNEGKIFNNDEAKIIGKKLKEILDTDKINLYIDKHKENCEKFKDIIRPIALKFDKKLIKEFSNFCLNSGGFKIL
tara:strand:- start:286 stop:645 length:360 start_codon:yes stop_codon:yes gene_type:complete